MSIERFKWGRSATFLLGGFLLGVYALTSFGGVRSPDSEIVFRTAESLATRLEWDVAVPLESWPEFGLATGADGKKYSVFGPAQSVLAAPLIALGNAINATKWYEKTAFPIPPNHLLDYGFDRALRGIPLTHRDGHALRFMVSLFNSIVTALTGIVIWKIAFALWGCARTALTLTFFYAFGTLAWPYAGTFFSEPLASLFAVSSLLEVVRWNLAQDRWALAARAGLYLGLATATHITAILFLPFLLFVIIPWPINRRIRPYVPALAFVIGLSIPLAFLGWHNFARFGNLFETGRSVDSELAETLKYGHWVAPAMIHHLLVGPAKGLLLFCPAVAVALFWWPAFYRGHRRLAVAIAAAAVFRLIFIACRSDWHGGFCLGPRYLLLLVPMLILPLGAGLHHAFSTGRLTWIRAAFVLALLGIIQQAYFVSTEVFGYLYLTRLQSMADNLRFGNIHESWHYSPLYRMLNGPTGPWLANAFGMRPIAAWLTIATALTCITFVLYRLVRPSKSLPVDCS